MSLLLWKHLKRCLAGPANYPDTGTRGKRGRDTVLFRGLVIQGEKIRDGNRHDLCDIVLPRLRGLGCMYNLLFTPPSVLIASSLFKSEKNQKI